MPATPDSANDSTDNDTDTETTYFVGEFSKPFTGPASGNSTSVGFVTIGTDDDTGHPVFTGAYPDMGVAPAETRQIPTPWPPNDGPEPIDAVRIPDATDLTDPLQTAIWGALLTKVGFSDLRRSEGGAAFAVFEVERRNIHEEWLEANGHQSADVPLYTQVSRNVETADSPNISVIKRETDWNSDLASVADLPDADEIDLPAVTPAPTKPVRPTDDELFELLANRRRRFAMHYLQNHPDDLVTLSELSEQVAGWEHGVEPEQLDYRERKSVRNSLHQFHLPKLDDAGVVEYDDRASEVQLLSESGARAYHDVVDDDDRPWYAYFLGASTAMVVTYGLVYAGVLTVLSNLAWAGLFVATFTVLSVYFAYAEHGNDLNDVGPPPECID
jgi:hypothetical protein